MRMRFFVGVLLLSTLVSTVLATLPAVRKRPSDFIHPQDSAADHEAESVDDFEKALDTGDFETVGSLLKQNFVSEVMFDLLLERYSPSDAKILKAWAHSISPSMYKGNDVSFIQAQKLKSKMYLRKIKSEKYKIESTSEFVQEQEMDEAAQARTKILSAISRGNVKQFREILFRNKLKADSDMLVRASESISTVILKTVLGLPDVDLAHNEYEAFFAAIDKKRYDNVAVMLEDGRVDVFARNRAAFEIAKKDENLASVFIEFNPHFRMYLFDGYESDPIQAAVALNRVSIVKEFLRRQDFSQAIDKYRNTGRYDPFTLYGAGSDVIPRLAFTSRPILEKALDNEKYYHMIPGYDHSMFMEFYFEHISYHLPLKPNDETIATIIQTNADLDFSYKDYWFVKKSVEYGSYTLVEALLKSSRVRIPSNIRDDLLQAAASKGHEKIFSLLLDDKRFKKYRDSVALVQLAIQRRRGNIILEWLKRNPSEASLPSSTTLSDSFSTWSGSLFRVFKPSLYFYSLEQGAVEYADLFRVTDKELKDEKRWYHILSSKRMGIGAVFSYVAESYSRKLTRNKFKVAAKVSIEIMMLEPTPWYLDSPMSVRYQKPDEIVEMLRTYVTMCRPFEIYRENHQKKKEIDPAGLIVPPQDRYEYSLIRIAAEYGHEELVALMLDIPEINERHGWESAFIAACYRGYPSIVKLLLSSRFSNPSVQDNICLRLAAEYGHTEVVQILLGDGRSSVTAQDNEAIKIAIKNGRIDLVKVLVDAYPDLITSFGSISNPSIKYEDYTGRLPLRFAPIRVAAERGDIKSVKLLISKSGPQDIVDAYSAAEVHEYDLVVQTLKLYYIAGSRELATGETHAKFIEEAEAVMDQLRQAVIEQDITRIQSLLKGSKNAILLQKDCVSNPRINSSEYSGSWPLCTHPVLVALDHYSTAPHLFNELYSGTKKSKSLIRHVLLRSIVLGLDDLAEKFASEARMIGAINSNEAVRLAIEYGRFETFRAVLPSVNVITVQWEPLFELAATLGNFKVAMFILRHGNAVLEQRENRAIAISGSVQLYKFAASLQTMPDFDLADHNIPDYRITFTEYRGDKEQMYTPLRIASEMCHTEVVEYLLMKRPSDRVFEDALRAAIYQGRRAVLDILLKHSNARIDDFSAGLAVQTGDCDIIQLILDHPSATQVDRLLLVREAERLEFSSIVEMLSS